MDTEITLRVNGIAAKLVVDDAAPLLHVLRNQMDLRASRFGCGLEQCGACMVLMDGAPTYACSFLAIDADGRSIETAEALGSHPLREAFLIEQAGQCGYCLSGILMSAKALLDRTPDAGREEIIAALDPHLCRCGAHERIIRAVERAGRMMQETVA